jgi:flagellar hook-associated protein FlgK
MVRWQGQKLEGLADKFHMDITSVARGGLEAAQGALEKTAVRLARAAAAGTDGSPGDGVDLSADMVALLSAKEQFQVNARVIRTADQMQKNLLDVLA